MSTFASEKREHGNAEKLFAKLGAYCCLFLAVGHFLSLFFFDWVCKFYQMEEHIHPITQYGEFVPYLVSLFMSLTLAVGALYGFSAAGIVKRPLPYFRAVMAFIIVLTMTRACIGIGRLVYNFKFIEIISIILSGGIGFCYLFGTNIRLKYKNDK